MEINDPATNQRIKEVAEKAKMELSSANEADISLPFIGMDANNAPINFEAQLTRLQFEEMTKDLFERTKEPVKKALQDANLNITDIDEVILIGGSTRIPAVQSLVREVTGKEPNRTINPDEAVAMGAAILAGVKENKIEEIHLEDITPFSIGLRSNGGHNTIIIPRKSSIPFVKTEICTTSHDLQTRVNIQVLQGEDLDANNNVVLGEFVLDEIEKAKQGIPQIEVTFKLDASGILTVSAKNKKTGKEKEITITNPL
ncbi:Hsp70 family protein [bacterium]|nr:Hsp70 family protein [bacterium]